MQDVDIKQFKQTTVYNCAAGAVAFFVHAQTGLVLDVEKVTQKLACDPETGTTYGSVVGYLDYLFRYDGIQIEYGHDIRVQEFTLPMLVRYWDGDDTHYGVITEINLLPGVKTCLLFDPWTGAMELQDWDHFVENWYTPKWGRYWGLYIARKAS